MPLAQRSFLSYVVDENDLPERVSAVVKYPRLSNVTETIIRNLLAWWHGIIVLLRVDRTIELIN